MKYKILGPNDYKNMPWKNGGGTTCEILREPADDSLPFDWRVSVADIKENGPFSFFPGYSRIINTLEGVGMRLTVDGRKSGDLTQYQPFAFEGDSATSSELINGPIRDFNLIYRTGAYQASLKWLSLSEPKTFTSTASRIIIYTVKPLSIQFGAAKANLEAAQTLYIQNPQTSLDIHLLPPANTHTCVIELSQ